MAQRSLTLVTSVLAISWFLSVTTPVVAEEVSKAEWGAVLNLSGRQRMLTQKMPKECNHPTNSIFR